MIHCPICLESLESLESIESIENMEYIIKQQCCKNLIHRKCLYKWLKIKNNCPLCREEDNKYIEELFLKFLINVSIKIINYKKKIDPNIKKYALKILLKFIVKKLYKFDCLKYNNNLNKFIYVNINNTLQILKNY